MNYVKKASILDAWGDFCINQEHADPQIYAGRLMALPGNGSPSPSSSQARLRRTRLSCMHMQAAPAVLSRSDCQAPLIREVVLPALSCIASSTSKPVPRHPLFVFTCPPSSQEIPDLRSTQQLCLNCHEQLNGSK